MNNIKIGSYVEVGFGSPTERSGIIVDVLDDGEEDNRTYTVKLITQPDIPFFIKDHKLRLRRFQKGDRVTYLNTFSMNYGKKGMISDLNYHPFGDYEVCLDGGEIIRATEHTLSKIAYVELSFVI